MWNIWLYFTLTSFVALLTYDLDAVDDRADRLAIAVAIIFVQMGLKWDSSRKTPRVKYVTCLDVHMFLSLSLVVFQAIGQAVTGWFYNGSNLVQAERNLLIVNILAVVIVNIGTVSGAKLRQMYKRWSLEEKLREFTSFNSHPLSKYSKDDIGNLVRISGWQVTDKLQISPMDLEESLQHTKLNFEKNATCCRRFKRKCCK